MNRSLSLLIAMLSAFLSAPASAAVFGAEEFMLKNGMQEFLFRL